MLARLERASNSRGEFMAVPLGWGSNMTSNLSLAHGFVRLASHETITDGEEVEVRLLGTDVLSDVV
jgi:molybdopterin biosynthesis enzyme